MSRIRHEPHDPSLFESEAWRRFWIGKSPRVKKATREYMENYRTQNALTQWDSANKNKVAEISIGLNIKKMKEIGLIEDLKHWSNFVSRSRYK